MPTFETDVQCQYRMQTFEQSGALYMDTRLLWWRVLRSSNLAVYPAMYYVFFRTKLSNPCIVVGVVCIAITCTDARLIVLWFGVFYSPRQIVVNVALDSHRFYDNNNSSNNNFICWEQNNEQWLLCRETIIYTEYKYIFGHRVENQITFLCDDIYQYIG